MKQILLLLSLFLVTTSLLAQQKYSISGTAREAKTGEELIGATVFLKEIPNSAVITNAYGFFSITVPAGEYTLVARYVGYQELSTKLVLDKNQSINLQLEPRSTELKEVQVESRKNNENVTKAQMGTVKLDMKEVNKIPVIFGERDILKTLQLLPGVKSAGDGNSGFYVRGGAADQNLILLDEAPVYNASHLLGFFSTFNSDAVKDVTLYKGNMPAEYGGRLASVVDIKMKDGNDKNYVVSGGVGLISSRLNVEGPIVQDKGSFIVSARRTYADVFLKLSSDSNLRKSKLYFYDINAKANYRLGKKDRIYFSGYFGRDVFGFQNQFQIDYGNSTGTLRWNHIFNDRLFSNTSLIYSNFSYNINIGQGLYKLNIQSVVRDFNIKEDLQYFLSINNTIKFGYQSIFHWIIPGSVTSADTSTVNSLTLGKKYAWENAFYASHDVTLWKKVNIVYGLRLAVFSLAGPEKLYSYDSNQNVIDSSSLKLGQLGKTYVNPEPRVAISYNFLPDHSFKVSYSRNTQNVHLLSNSTSASPTDLWVMNSNNIKPEVADQFSLGYYLNFAKGKFELSVEGYYKYMYNQIDYIKNAQLRANENVESQLVFGNGRAYGGEFFLKKKTGKFTGWLSYTLSRSERQIVGINDGNYYPAKQDRTHDVSLVLMYDINPRLNISAVWVYQTGNAVTYPTGKYNLNFGLDNLTSGQTTSINVGSFTDRNQDRMPAYHRLDLGLTYQLKQHKWFGSELVFSIYNLYAQKNPYAINFKQDKDDPNKTAAYKLYLFRIVPSISWNFKFTAPSHRKAKS